MIKHNNLKSLKLAIQMDFESLLQLYLPVCFPQLSADFESETLVTSVARYLDGATFIRNKFSI